jgi:hypothetical protein
MCPPNRWCKSNNTIQASGLAGARSFAGACSATGVERVDPRRFVVHLGLFRETVEVKRSHIALLFGELVNHITCALVLDRIPLYPF